VVIVLLRPVILSAADELLVVIVELKEVTEEFNDDDAL
jgi:hypothetical protein